MSGSSIDALQLPFSGEEDEAGAETAHGVDGPPFASKEASDDETDAASPDTDDQVGAPDGEALSTPDAPDDSTPGWKPALLLLPSLRLPLPLLFVQEAAVVGVDAARHGYESAGANRSADSADPP